MRYAPTDGNRHPGREISSRRRVCIARDGRGREGIPPENREKITDYDIPESPITKKCNFATSDLQILFNGPRKVWGCGAEKLKIEVPLIK